ncbi:haloacid dehalogenase-like hydrolase superfamily [Micractinium conductrix]|uniref:Haloacid dehalogenase-like hydrolase superfamily n=1 Tax=Micractinium conductrix TaxID=554055 RepID=A0A2P6VGF9_9CHLO|nr:haloacid dehalogenase-like hydrolase superfamily [Micractinium conductrix]|eukprot:PSC73179.1 haloacid dehalogenase-like hydrolase superfamily [Micractinium conductrix]
MASAAVAKAGATAPPLSLPRAQARGAPRLAAMVVRRSAGARLRGAVQPRAMGRGTGGAGSSGQGPFNGPQHGRGERERNLLNAVSNPERAGSEYGEGFVQFRVSGERIHLDVDTLNEQMKIGGAQRIRHSMRPDEAHGLIFNWDNVVADTRGLQRKAWRAVAEAEGLPFPSIERQQLYDMRPERAVTDVLLWTRDWKRAQELAWLVATQYAQLLLETAETREGVTDWLQLMGKTKVPCALVTSMDRHTTDELLARLGLRNYFTCLVTADDDMETMAQRFLSAAIKLGRPPNQCVTFSADPTSITAAHNCSMKAVALLGPHKAFTLKNADLTCASMAELTVYNIRRLFANQGSEHMDLTKKIAGQPPPRRRITHATFDGDDDEW